MSTAVVKRLHGYHYHDGYQEDKKFGNYQHLLTWIFRIISGLSGLLSVSGLLVCIRGMFYKDVDNENRSIYFQLTFTIVTLRTIL